MTGNDIVDLKFARVPLGEKRMRFLEKLFTPGEKDIIDHGEVGIWSIWAMKEAIYKAHHRRFDLSRSFDPKKIEVSKISAAQDFLEARGEYEAHTYWGSGNLTSEYVHFNATCNPGNTINTEVHQFGIDIKNRLKQLIAEKLKLDIKEISIVKNKNNIPQLYYKNKFLNLPFSISHHGKFAAFSCQLINY